MLEEISGQVVSLCRGQEWGISEGCNGIERVEAPWCAGDPLWAPEDVENPTLGFAPCPQPALGLWIPEEQVYEGENQEREREGHAANGVPTQIFAFTYKQDLLRRGQSPGNDPKTCSGAR